MPADRSNSSPAESGTPVSRPLSLSFYTVAELGPLDSARIAAAAGCQHLGLRLLGGQPGGGETELLTDPALRRALRDTMANLGITALDANTVRLVPESDVNAYLPFFDAAAELGARHVLATVDDSEPARLAGNLARLCEFAGARALTIDFEFVPWLQLSNLEQAARLVRQCDNPLLGISVDALHYFRSHGNPAQIEQLPREWFRYAQMCDVASPEPPASVADFIAEATRERLPPGEGIIDLPGLLRALPPGIPLALEVPQLSLAQSVPASARVKHAVGAMRRVLESAGTA